MSYTVEGLMALVFNVIAITAESDYAESGYSPNLSAELAEIRAYAAALASPPQARDVPAGYALVPCEPTPEIGAAALLRHAIKLASRIPGVDGADLFHTLNLIAEPRELPLYKIMEAFAEAFPGHDMHQESIDFARAIERDVLAAAPSIKAAQHGAQE